MKFHCPNCQQKYETAEDSGGQQVDCQACGTSFVVPAAGIARQPAPGLVRQVKKKSGGGLAASLLVLLAVSGAGYAYFRLSNAQPPGMVAVEPARVIYTESLAAPGERSTDRAPAPEPQPAPSTASPPKIREPARPTGTLRRPISPQTPMWLIHIDTWSYADPQKIIDLVPLDIRPFVVMNISISIGRDPATGKFSQAEYGYETAKSWVRTCAENRMWTMIQQSSGGFAHFSEKDLSVYEEFFRDYPNFIGFNYAEQFWGFGDKLSVTWEERFAHFTNLMKLNRKYGGYLVVSWCGAYYGAGINPIAMMKRNPDFAAVCKESPENFILCDKFTSKYGFHDIQSTVLGTYLSGYSGHYGLRSDDTGWTGIDGQANGDPDDEFPVAAGAGPILERFVLSGQTVVDGPELIWGHSIHGLSDGKTADGYTTRRWELHPQMYNINVDIYRKVLDGTVRILSRKEVIDRTKVVIINDVDAGNDQARYSAPITLFEGLYQMDVDGNLLENRYWFKKTGRYPAVPTVHHLGDDLAKSFPLQVNKSNYQSRWGDIGAKVNEFNTLFPEEYKGDLFVGRSENTWVTYNPYKANQTARAAIPLKYNTCGRVDLAYTRFTSGIVKEFSDKITFYLTNYDPKDPSLKTNGIKIYGCTSEPEFSYVDRGSHPPSKVGKSWSDGTFTLLVAHNGPIDITVKCSGTATPRLQPPGAEPVVAPDQPALYTGPRQHEAENFDFRNIQGNVTQGAKSGVENYTAQGYLKFGTSSTASIRKRVDVPESGIYLLETRYSVIGGDVSTIDLHVNGTKVATPGFARTPTHSDWSVDPQNVSLKGGENIIEFRASGSGAHPIHFDNIVLSPTGQGESFPAIEAKSR